MHSAPGVPCRVGGLPAAARHGPDPARGPHPPPHRARPRQPPSDPGAWNRRFSLLFPFVSRCSFCVHRTSFRALRAREKEVQASSVRDGRRERSEHTTNLQPNVCGESRGPSSCCACPNIAVSDRTHACPSITPNRSRLNDLCTNFMLWALRHPCPTVTPTYTDCLTPARTSYHHRRSTSTETTSCGCSTTRRCRTRTRCCRGGCCRSPQRRRRPSTEYVNPTIVLVPQCA